MREPELPPFPDLPTASLPAKSPTLNSQPPLQPRAPSDRRCHICPLGSNTCCWFYTLGGALESKSLIQCSVSTHCARRWGGGGDCARPPGETSSQHAALQTPPLPALVCTACQIANHRNKEYFKGAGILMVQLYHFTGEGAEVHRGRVLSRVPLSNKSQSWERGHVSNPSSQFFFHAMAHTVSAP